MTYVFITDSSYSLPLAVHLLQEGQNVVVGFIKDRSFIRLPELRSEDAEYKKERISLYDGILDKRSPESVISMLRGVPKSEQDDYFIFFDDNHLYKISEDILRMGFRNGLFPTKEYRQLEKDRKFAKYFVEEYYDGKIKVAEHHEFKKVSDGIAFIADSNDIFVVKSNGNEGKTIVPHSDDLDIEKEIMIEALENDKRGYEKNGFTLEKKIPNALEVTPIMLCWNGEPIYTLAEFENKSYGSGNIGAQKGGNQCLSVRTELDCNINRIAFPDVIYEMAKQQPGMSIYDAGLLFDGNDFYFTEFAGNRFGFDGLYCEIGMRDIGDPFVSSFFEDVMNSRSPILNPYGTSVRLFNYEGDMEDTDDPLGSIPVRWDESIDNNLFLYHVRKENKHIVSTSESDFIGCVTAASDSTLGAIDIMYERVRKVHFEKIYYRPQFDFLSLDYRSSILNRYDQIRKYLE